MVFVDGNAERIPNYSDGVVRLTGFAPVDVEAHLAGEDDETARRFGWWPNSSTEETVLRAFDEWAAGWRTNGAVQTSGAAQASEIGREQNSGRDADCSIDLLMSTVCDRCLDLQDG